MSEKKKVDDQARTCPWCDKNTVPKMNILKKSYGEVTERRCSDCGKVLAAYLEGEGNFMPKIRSYKTV